ncbi:MAG: anthranilate phosphoribosyltransferase [Alphaproteobacteria bacterium]|nr:anthranilate phosphoribosyltransferase [Alphaproteobacteria bacterium]MBU1560960.1 anthranilate phosphoribosyltransferase [Alphaproteobacteria bacterium]MBU2304934.1 anthranilate phosphoribosyltransferase [Alphaproteobacteria bacterium]MBU2370185.1 anthranilate phosphoribosyltransferase [Alphaproteobacteria bacterium]
MMDLKAALNKIADRKDLTGEEMRGVMRIIMAGEATPSQIGAFLMGMRIKGETVGEIAAAVSILREQMVPVIAPEGAIDIVGTGGDGIGSLNISTATALVVAGAGVPVAKHGNKALSSRSGASQVLEALGVKLDLTPEQIGTTIAKAGIGFMFAPSHHPAMRHVGPARSEMGVRTLFNLLGPQSNPAGVRRYLLGVYSQQWVEPVAAALLANRAIKAWVVHSSEGLDELSTSGTNFVAQIAGGDLRSFELNPEQVGLKLTDPKDLLGGTPEENALAIQALLEGAPGAYRDTVLLNAGAALLVADKVATIEDGIAMAAQTVDSGKARETLARLVAVSNGRD